ncbi:MAG: transcription termination/antitermination protein NusA [Oscillospiraceae bacterium]|nr:transcription termination/antitermination protein NusA [Oscillospiraceae bacterium]
MNTKDLFEALKSIQQTSGIGGEELIEKIKQGILKAVKRDYPDTENVYINIDPEKQKFEMNLLKLVVEEVNDPANEITLDEAKTYHKRIALGQMCEIPLSPATFGRVAASSAKQSIRSDIKQFERDRLVAQYQDKEHELVSATVQKVEPATGNAIVTIGSDEIYFPRNEQIPGEELKAGDIIKVYVVGVINPDKKPSVKVSRTHRDFVRRLFELEVPEIYDGTVEVKAISREAGSRSKIAVVSNNPDVDAIGACIGTRRARITAIVDELGGEKIDIINYSEDDAEFIAKALAPAEVINVTLADDGTRSCTVVVPNNQLSLAIGNKGQNAKLAARLTGYKIDIVPLNKEQ